MKKIISKFSWLLAFLKIGCIGFGGGTSLIPVIEQEMVNERRLVPKDKYDIDVIVASITPGALPVEISGSLGKRIGGIWGMLLAALCMTAPGALATMFLLSGMSYLSDNVFTQIEIVAIGIAAFILSMLTKYISGAFKWAKEHDRMFFTVAIILGVLVLNSGKPFYKILGLFGINASPIFNVSTVNILLVTFFVVIFTHCKFTKSNVIISGLVSSAFIYHVSAFNKRLMETKLADSPYYNLISDGVYYGLIILMVILSVYGFIHHLDKKGSKSKKLSFKGTIKEESAWLLFLIAMSLPAFFVFSDTISFIGRGYLSSIMSFGGGDAYLTIADSLFVSDVPKAGYIDTNTFYTNIVTLVNVLPGSILCKTLTGVGYCLGYNETGSVLCGYAVASVGFGTAIVGSCSVVSLIQYVFEKFEEIRVLEILKSWVKVIISGLLGSVILNLIYSQCLDMSIKTGGTSAPTTDFGLLALLVLDMVVIYALNMVLEKYTKVSTGLRVVISCVLALVIGNLIMFL